MTESSSNPADNRRNFLVWLLFPLALFPLAALTTYDWRAIPELCDPPLKTSNWIGALGDWFAYCGYSLLGLAIWAIPVVCIIVAIALVRGRRIGLARRSLSLTLFFIALAGLLQSTCAHTPAIAKASAAVNTASAGGAIGYLVVTRGLAPLISDFAAAIVMVIVLAAAFVAAVGMHNILNALTAIVRWSTEGADRIHLPSRDDFFSAAGDTGGDAGTEPTAEQQAYLAALQAKEEAKRQRLEEKEAARAAKIARKEAAKAEKLAAKEAKIAAKEAPKAAPSGAEADEPEDKGPYVLPSLSLLNPLKKSSADHSDVGEMRQRLVDTLKLFGIDATVAYDVQGPVVTKYALSLAPGTRYSAVTNISDNLMGALRAKSLRIEAPIPGEDHIGVEVPNRAPAGISFREIFESPAWRNFKGELPLLFGKDAAGKELIADLASMPHMLVAGATGQGKSVCLNSIINGLLMTKTPEQLKLIMVDPKSVEFTSYAAIPHLIVPIITENRKAATSLMWAVAEMEKRLKLFARARVRNIYDFNHRLQFTQTDMFGADTAVGSDMPKTVPYVVIIIDEVADLMSQCAKEVVPHISRLTAKARAAGIHLILATQRPDAKVITGTIKANIPGRVAFKTATSIDSRTILDDGGAENLIGRGDMLFKSKEGLLIRAQGAWISDEEIARVTAFIEQHANTQFDEKFKKNLDRIKDQEIDPFAELNAEDDAAAAKESAAAAKEQVKADAAASDFKKAVECVINTKRASTSHFQRQMGWGYNHAAKILDMLEAKGIVAPASGMGPRQIIMDPDELLAIFNGGEASAEPAEPAPEPSEPELPL